MNSNTSKSVSVTAVTKRVRNNRKNGKRYEGELVKTLKEMGISSRLGRSNEEGDVILPEHNLVIEVKSTNLRDRYPISKSPDQFFLLKNLSQEVWYAVRFKGSGILGWRFFRIPEKIRVLLRTEGYSLDEFVFMKMYSKETTWESDT